MPGSKEQRYTASKDRFPRRKNLRAKLLRKNFQVNDNSVNRELRLTEAPKLLEIMQP